MQSESMPRAAAQALLSLDEGQLSRMPGTLACVTAPLMAPSLLLLIPLSCRSSVCLMTVLGVGSKFESVGGSYIASGLSQVHAWGTLCVHM